MKCPNCSKRVSKKMLTDFISHGECNKCVHPEDYERCESDDITDLAFTGFCGLFLTFLYSIMYPWEMIEHTFSYFLALVTFLSTLIFATLTADELERQGR